MLQGTAIGLVALDWDLTQAQNLPPCYFDASTPTQVRFNNETGRPIALYWQNYQCETVSIGDAVQPGWTLTLNAFLNIPLLVYDAETGELLQELRLTPTTPSEITIPAIAQIDQSIPAEGQPSIAPVGQAAEPTSDSSQLAQSQWIQTILTTHNQYRSEVNVSPLTWSSELANDGPGLGGPPRCFWQAIFTT